MMYKMTNFLFCRVRCVYVHYFRYGSSKLISQHRDISEIFSLRELKLYQMDKTNYKIIITNVENLYAIIARVFDTY